MSLSLVFASPIPAPGGGSGVGCFGGCFKGETSDQPSSSSTNQEAIKQEKEKKYRQSRARQIFKNERTPITKEVKMKFKAATEVQHSAIREARYMIEGRLKPKKEANAMRPTVQNVQAQYTKAYEAADTNNEEIQNLVDRLGSTIRKLREGDLDAEARPLIKMKKCMKEYLALVKEQPHKKLEDIDWETFLQGPEDPYIKIVLDEMVAKQTAISELAIKMLNIEVPK
jgi:hypothetical protein